MLEIDARTFDALVRNHDRRSFGAVLRNLCRAGKRDAPVPDALNAHYDRAAADAAPFGITAPKALAVLAYAGMVAGADFYRHPACHQVLTNASLPPDSRPDLLLTAEFEPVWRELQARRT